VTAISMAMATADPATGREARDVPYAFNRKVGALATAFAPHSPTYSLPSTARWPRTMERAVCWSAQT
jgi:hypothetical protein